MGCGSSLEPPWQGSSSRGPQAVVWAEVGKIMFYYVEVGCMGAFLGCGLSGCGGWSGSLLGVHANCGR